MLQRGGSCRLVAETHELSSHTVRNIYHQMCEKMWEVIIDRHRMFESPMEVEMDETYMKWKWNSRSPEFVREEEGQWMIGMVSRGWDMIWIEPLASRELSKMRVPIEKMIRPHTRVYTDANVNYRSIMEGRYDLQIINKKREGFCRVIEESGVKVHVNNCECLWCLFREHMHTRFMWSATAHVDLCADYMYKHMNGQWLHLIVH
jgi:hypothetical protein